MYTTNGHTLNFLNWGILTRNWKSQK